MAYDRFQRDQLILRDELALDRTKLANERTLLAYVRTAIMLLVSGVSLLKLFPESFAAVSSGWVLNALGGAVAVTGLLRFVRVRRSLRGLGRDE